MQEERSGKPDYFISASELGKKKNHSDSNSYIAPNILIQFFKSYVQLLWTVPHVEANWKQ